MPSLYSLQSPDELLVALLWIITGICIHWLFDPLNLSIPSVQWTEQHLKWQRSMLQHQWQCSGEWYLVTRDHMFWRNTSIDPRLACHESFAYKKRPRMVNGKLVRREETDWGEFLNFWRLILLECGLRQKSASLLCLTPFPSMGKATNTFEKAQKHLFYDKNSGNTRPVQNYNCVWWHVSWQAWFNYFGLPSSSVSFLPGRAIWLWHTRDVLPWYGCINLCICPLCLVPKT